jgi:hypothetical protein
VEKVGVGQLHSARGVIGGQVVERNPQGLPLTGVCGATSWPTSATTLGRHAASMIQPMLRLGGTGGRSLAGEVACRDLEAGSAARVDHEVTGRSSGGAARGRCVHAGDRQVGRGTGV